MAGVIGPRTTQTDQQSLIRFVDDMIDVLSPETVPFLKLIGIDGEEGTNPKLEWMEDELLGESVKLAADVSDTDFGLNVGAGNVHHFQKGTVLLVQDAARTKREYMWVVQDPSPGNGFIVVARAIDDGTAQTFSANDDIFILGIAVAEGDTNPPVKGTTTVNFKYNNFQIFETTYIVSKRQSETPYYYAESDPDYQLEKALKEVMIKLENQAILGVRKDAGAAPANVPAQMGGIDYFITTNVTDLGGNPLTETSLLDHLDKLYKAVGLDNMGKVILCNSWVKRKIASFYDNRMRTQRKDEYGGNVVNEIDTDFGVIDVLMMNRIPQDTLFVVNPKFLKIHPYRGSRFYDEELAKTSANIVKHIYGDYTLKVKNEKAMGKIVRISTSS
jgi:hypothetical protein